MSHVRIKAIYLDNGVPSTEHMVFDLPLNANGQVGNGNVTGYAVEDAGLYPFVMRPCRQRSRSDIDWGAYGEGDCTSHTNLRDKPIREGELFTRVDCRGDDAEEYTYRIEQLVS